MATEAPTQSIIQTDARIVSNRDVIEGHKVLVCHAPAIARSAQPGHFVNAFASGTINSILRKPFSIFQADPDAGNIAILYQVHGATTYGMARKQPGDLLDLVGPLGGRVFRADPTAGVTHVMVGGGYGVPPLVFLAERLKEKNPRSDIRFIVGARSKNLLLCETELAGLNVHSHMTTEDGSHGVRGRVTDVLETLVRPNVPLAVYTCGPTGMMRAVAEMCVGANVACQVSLEVPMPCGIGVCMGCVIDLAVQRRVRACTEGPVFDAHDVTW